VTRARVAWLALLLVPLAAGAGDETRTSPNERFLALGRESVRGAYPRYFHGEQTTWTAIGPDGGPRQALLSSDGLLEVDRRSFSIEPRLVVGGKQLGWADVAATQALHDGDLPIATVGWRAESLELEITAFATPASDDAVLHARYRLANRGAEKRRVALALRIVPFQVNPPWQDLGVPGGVSAVHHVAREGRVVRVNGAKAIALSREPDAADFESPLTDAAGFATAALRWDFELAPAASAEVSIATPFGDPRRFLASLPDASQAPVSAAAAQGATARHWRARLDQFELALPSGAPDLPRALRAAAAQILVARDGPMLRPGTRVYARSWIRDGVLMASALLQLGLADEARAFLRWYAPLQQADGRVPCCVDERGPDPVPEHDSPGELVYGVLSLWRYQRDAAFVRELWPHVVRAVDFIDALRRQRLGAAYDAPERRAFRGLLPESISHEGYWKNPVHSYWDDAWALRGLDDAVLAAQLLGERDHAQRFAALRDAFARDLRASIDATMQRHRIETLPASADLGDFDPTATTIWLAPGRARALLPAEALARTYAVYVEDFRARRSGAKQWEAYAPYELRNVEALVRLGRRDDALFVLHEILADQRPPGWRQWSEIVHRDPAAPKFVGDMPHAWVAATFVRAARSLFVYERDDGALVLGAGVPLAWLEGSGVAFRLPTHYGVVGARLRRSGERALAVEVDALAELPPGGVVIEPPVAIRAARVDGAVADGDPLRLRALPARVEIEY
jgi:hypothetical protein